MNKQQPLGWQQWLLIAGLVLSLVVAGVFAIHGLQRFPRRQVDEPIRAWMSVPYIARSHRVPAAVLFVALGLPAQPPDRRPLMAIARAQNRPVATLIAELQNAIVHSRPPFVLTPTATAGSTP
jgi:hypothetical protein